VTLDVLHGGRALTLLRSILPSYVPFRTVFAWLRNRKYMPLK